MLRTRWQPVEHQPSIARPSADYQPDRIRRAATPLAGRGRRSKASPAIELDEPEQRRGRIPRPRSSSHPIEAYGTAPRHHVAPVPTGESDSAASGAPGRRGIVQMHGKGQRRRGQGANLCCMDARSADNDAETPRRAIDEVDWLIAEYGREARIMRWLGWLAASRLSSPAPSCR
jgi:hypothetical protein